MTSKYYANVWFVTIDKKEIIKETDKFVFFNNGYRELRQAKISDSHGWFDTFKEAKKWLVCKHQSYVDNARLSLQNANGKLKNAKGLKNDRLEN